MRQKFAPTNQFASRINEARRAPRGLSRQRMQLTNIESDLAAIKAWIGSGCEGPRPACVIDLSAKPAGGYRTPTARSPAEMCERGLAPSLPLQPTIGAEA